jgi:hypothetical protein
LDFSAETQERAAGMTGRPPKRGLLALFVFEFREPFENERVSLISQLVILWSIFCAVLCTSLFLSDQKQRDL